LPTNPTQVETWRESGFKAFVGANRLLLSGRRESATFWLLAGKPFPISQVAQILGCGRLEILLMVREFIRDATFRRHFESVLASCKGIFEAIALLYTICRTLRPRVVVELGVASGVSSAILLLAMNKNQQGQLISVDLPNYDNAWVDAVLAKEGRIPGRSFVDNSLPEDKGSGWAVPPNLRDRWELILGDTRDVLPSLVARIDEIDLALHDSDHSSEAVSAEGLALWSKLRDGGLLIVDDIDVSEGFDQLSDTLTWRQRLVVGRVGILKK